MQIDSKSYSAPRSNSGLTQAIKYVELEQLKLIQFMEFTNPMDGFSMVKKIILPPKIETADGSCLM